LKVLLHIIQGFSWRDGLKILGYAWTGFFLSKIDSICPTKNIVCGSFKDEGHIVWHGGNTLRSGTQQRLLTPRRCIWRWLSTQANWELLVSRSGKGFLLASCHARPWRAVTARAAPRYASMRVWVPNVSCCQWMMTMSLSHNVSECVFVYFGVIVKSPKKHFARTPCTPKCLAEVVIAEPWLCTWNFNQMNKYSFNEFSSSWIDNSLLHALDPFQLLWLCQFLEGDTQNE